MAGGGIGVDYTLRNLPRMLPGLLLCILFGWLALLWDATIHNWEKEYKEAGVVVSALKEFEAVMRTVAKDRFGADWTMLTWVHSQLHFLVVVTLNNAFYQVREAESHAFYELFRVEVESRSLEELLPRMLSAR